MQNLILFFTLLNLFDPTPANAVSAAASFPANWSLRVQQSMDPCPDSVRVSVTSNHEWTLRFDSENGPVKLESQARHLTEPKAVVYSDFDRKEVHDVSVEHLASKPILAVWIYESGSARFAAGFHCEFEPRDN